MLGTVNTEFHANDPDFKLPQNSRYAPIKDIIASWASGEAKPRGCSSQDFAESVVEDILRGTQPKVYKGNWAGMIKLLAAWVPTSLAVSTFKP